MPEKILLLKTLSTKSYKHTVVKAQQNGYFVTLIYFWLETPLLAEKRVELRVRVGGHYIPTDVIYRRYIKGIQNLIDIFLPLCDYTMIFDNSTPDPVLIYEHQKAGSEVVHDVNRWLNMKHYVK
jgi:predicted ABC-type ATPase